jgi:hypothetical protein
MSTPESDAPPVDPTAAADTAPTPPATPPIDERTRKAVLIGLIVLVAAGIGVALRGRGRPRPTSSGDGIELRLRSSASRVRVRFTAPGGMVTENVRMPWGYQLPATNGQPVSINASAAGDLTCEILLRGHPWRTQHASGPNATVSCEGVVGSP